MGVTVDIKAVGQKVRAFAQGIVCEPEMAGLVFDKQQLTSQLEQAKAIAGDTQGLLLQLSQAKAEVQQFSNELGTTKIQLAVCESKLPPVDPLDAIDEIWDNKRPKVDINYRCRYVMSHGTRRDYAVSLMNFWNSKDHNLRDLAKAIAGAKTTDDDKAYACLIWVMQNFQYVPDQQNEGVPEYWQYANESLELRQGDCDDGSILLANLMYHAGIRPKRIRLNAGDVVGGGHCYVTYRREFDEQFCTMDWCYQKTSALIKDRPLHRDQQSYYGIWWSWDPFNCYSNVTFLSDEKSVINPVNVHGD